MENPEEVFSWLDLKIKDRSEEITKFNAIVKFDIDGTGGGVWIASLKPESPGVEKGDGEADCTLKASDANFMKLVRREMRPETAILTGRIKLSGDISVAMRLANLFKP